MKRLLCIAQIICTTLTVAACSGGGGNNGATGSIRGVVFAPNGIDPIAQAVVYVPSSATGALSAISATTAATCEVPGVQVVTKTCAGADGAFVLSGVPVGVGVTVVIAKGLFKKEIKVNVTAGAPTVLAVVDTTLPVATGPGTQVPRIAVVTGSFDRMEDVLAKLGLGTVDELGALDLGTEKFVLFDGAFSLADATYPNFDVLLNSLDELKKFDLIMINCGTAEYESRLSDPDVVARLRQYVSDGGRLYVTDLSYDFIEQPFPKYIDFFGSDQVAEISPENSNEAEVGNSGITSVADILVSTLQSWLGSTVKCGSASTTSNTASCLDTNGKVHIEGFGGGWAMMETAHPAQANAVTVWTRGLVSWGLGDLDTKPLTMTFPSGAGKVLYSSYHTASESHPYMLPQERILQYLIFEIVQ